MNSEFLECPACHSKNKIDARICTSCGFPELGKLFINKEEGQAWFESVVLPYRARNYYQKLLKRSYYTQSLLDEPEDKILSARYFETTEKNAQAEGEWGPFRTIYRDTQSPSHPCINSLRKNALFGDERYFVRVAERGSDDIYKPVATLEAGKQYEVFLCIHNIASESENGKESNHQGVATRVRVSTTFPRILKANSSGKILGVITAYNTEPLQVWASAHITAKQDMLIQYVIGSAKIYNGWKKNGTVMATSLFSQPGTFAGLQELNGVIPSGDKYSSVIVYIIQTKAIEHMTDKSGKQVFAQAGCWTPSEDAMEDSYTGKGFATYADGGIYEGEFVNRRFNGKGTYKFAHGDIYNCEWANGKATGSGNILRIDGRTYSGELQNGKPHGVGTHIMPDGTIYEGHWVNGEKHGEGKETATNGKMYEGSWINGERSGIGKETIAGGSIVYEGEWLHGKRHGKGTETLKRSPNRVFIYEGEWIDGQRNGQGTETSSKGAKYVGEWKNGKRSGYGKETIPDGSVYEGEWLDGEKHGRGKETSNGTTYDGSFQNGKRNGPGTLVRPDGAIFEGEWLRGKLTGRAKLSLTDGTIYEGSWSNGQLEGVVKITYKSGGIYEGDFSDGKITGYGKETLPDGTVYDGAWLNGKKHGKGQLTTMQKFLKIKVMYEGNWNEGELDGEVLFTILSGMASGSKCMMEFENGKLKRKGKMIIPDDV